MKPREGPRRRAGRRARRRHLLHQRRHRPPVRRPRTAAHRRTPAGTFQRQRVHQPERRRRPDSSTTPTATGSGGSTPTRRSNPTPSRHCSTSPTRSAPHRVRADLPRGPRPPGPPGLRHGHQPRAPCPIADYPRDAMVQVAAVPAAFLLVHRSVLEAVRAREFSCVYPLFGSKRSAWPARWSTRAICTIRAGVCGYPVLG